MNQLTSISFSFPLLILIGLSACTKQVNNVTEIKVRSWITTADQSRLLAPANDLVFMQATGSDTAEIVVDTTSQYQTMDGFGYTLTGGSAYLINQKLKEADRKALLEELFGGDVKSIGISYLRISIGASDLDDRVFSYDDLPMGKTDERLSHFSLGPDQDNLIPVLKEILTLNPQIKIMGSPWSAPLWMKTNNAAKGGSLKTEYYGLYAKYFVNYIQQMEKEGIFIDAITIQNEPENPKNTPSLVMTWEEQNEFIKRHLGPAFKAAGIKTKIILFDHNCDHPEYPISILDDAKTKPFVDGSAFHMYVGEISAMDKVHSAHPDRNIYFTEQWTSGEGDFGGDLQWHVKNLIIGAPRNWSRNVLEWNLAADENFNPHTDDGGCTSCQGAITINNSTGVIKRNVSYYIIAHASKFVKPGSIRIASTTSGNLYNVAFLTPEGKKILIVLNEGKEEETFSIGYKNLNLSTSLPAGAVGTFVW